MELTSLLAVEQANRIDIPETITGSPETDFVRECAIDCGLCAVRVQTIDVQVKQVKDVIVAHAVANLKKRVGDLMSVSRIEEGKVP